MTDQPINARQRPEPWDLSTIDWDRWAPRTLMARASLIIVAPLIIVQIISTFIFYENHWDTMSHRMAASLAGDIAAVANFISEYPGEQNLAWMKDNATNALELTLSYEPGGTLSGGDVVRTQGQVPDDVLAEALWTSLNRPFAIDLAAYRAEKLISIRVELTQGALHVLAPRRRLYSSTTYIFVMWMAGSSILLFSVATVFLRNQVKTVRRLSRAVDEFGKGRDVPDFPPEGAFEVRQAARAFNIMRGRIRRQIAQRTEMLAGVSHDLRTPLTRMKLQLAMMDREIDPSDVAALKDDAADMERMLDAYLAFARGEGNEENTATDVAELLESVVAKYRRDGANVSLNIEANAKRRMMLRPIAFERCLNNLIGNGVRYAKNVVVSASIQNLMLQLVIDDDGPGIQPDKREDVFKPFMRLEESRNPQTGGVGLGLTIARDIARSMGGDVTLGENPSGGLRVNVSIPL